MPIGKKYQLLIDTTVNPAHCAFIAAIQGGRERGTVFVGKCCDGCFKAVRLTLKAAGMSDLKIVRG